MPRFHFEMPPLTPANTCLDLLGRASIGVQHGGVWRRKRKSLCASDGERCIGQNRNGSKNSNMARPSSTPTGPELAAAAVENVNTSTALALTGLGAGQGDDDAMPTLFSTRRPRNLQAGASSGLKSVAKGVAMGTAALVAGPTMGAREGGFKGFMAGLGAGILGFITLPVYGAVVGAVQVSRGALNTPEAFKERSRGKIWDEDTRTWVSYDLPGEAREMLALSEEEWCTQNGISLAGKADAKRKGEAVKESELYDALGVTTDASSDQIRKAYFKLAKNLHPDRNLDDPDAHEKFQAVGEAYQVLSNDDLRAKYDAQGKAALESQSMVDPTAFFAMLFGSEPFEHLIGELRLATMFSSGGEVSEVYLAYKQKRREVLCALNLSGLLAQFVFGDECAPHRLRPRCRLSAKSQLSLCLTLCLSRLASHVRLLCWPLSGARALHWFCDGNQGGVPLTPLTACTYMVTLVVGYLGWVDLDLARSTSLLGQ